MASAPTKAEKESKHKKDKQEKKAKKEFQALGRSGVEEKGTSADALSGPNESEKTGAHVEGTEASQRAPDEKKAKKEKKEKKEKEEKKAKKEKIHRSKSGKSDDSNPDPDKKNRRLSGTVHPHHREETEEKSHRRLSGMFHLGTEKATPEEGSKSDEEKSTEKKKHLPGLLNFKSKSADKSVEQDAGGTQEGAQQWSVPNSKSSDHLSDASEKKKHRLSGRLHIGRTRSTVDLHENGGAGDEPEKEEPPKKSDEETLSEKREHEEPMPWSVPNSKSSDHLSDASEKKKHRLSGRLHIGRTRSTVDLHENGGAGDEPEKEEPPKKSDEEILSEKREHEEPMLWSVPKSKSSDRLSDTASEKKKHRLSGRLHIGKSKADVDVPDSQGTGEKESEKEETSTEGTQSEKKHRRLSGLFNLKSKSPDKSPELEGSRSEEAFPSTRPRSKSSDRLSDTASVPEKRRLSGRLHLHIGKSRAGKSTTVGEQVPETEESLQLVESVEYSEDEETIPEPLALNVETDRPPALIESAGLQELDVLISLPIHPSAAAPEIPIPQTQASEPVETIETLAVPHENPAPELAETLESGTTVEPIPASDTAPVISIPQTQAREPMKNTETLPLDVPGEIPAPELAEPLESGAIVEKPNAAEDQSVESPEKSLPVLDGASAEGVVAPTLSEHPPAGGASEVGRTANPSLKEEQAAPVWAAASPDKSAAKVLARTESAIAIAEWEAKHDRSKPKADQGKHHRNLSEIFTRKKSESELSYRQQEVPRSPSILVSPSSPNLGQSRKVRQDEQDDKKKNRISAALQRHRVETAQEKEHQRIAKEEKKKEKEKDKKQKDEEDRRHKEEKEKRKEEEKRQKERIGDSSDDKKRRHHITRQKSEAAVAPPPAIPAPPPVPGTLLFGAFQLMISRATGLLAADRNGLSDPFVKL